MAVGSTLQIVLLIWCGWVSAQIEGKTKQTFWKKVAWSFEILWTGCWPWADENKKPYPRGSPEWKKAGTPLVGSDVAGCIFCVLWLIKGDLDMHHKDSGAML